MIIKLIVIIIVNKKHAVNLNETVEDIVETLKCLSSYFNGRGCNFTKHKDLGVSIAIQICGNHQGKNAIKLLKRKSEGTMFALVYT